MRYTAAAIILILSHLSEAAETVRGPQVAGYERFFSAQAPSPAGGGLLLSELSCTACHSTNHDHYPDLVPKRGPVLDGVGSRLSASWLRRFLANPHAVKPGTTMPHMFGGTDERQTREEIESLVHWLMSMSEPLGPEIVFDEADGLEASSFQRGFNLYHRVGCVACHDVAPLRPEGQPNIASDDVGSAERQSAIEGGSTPTPSIPLGDIRSKYSHATLTYFLHNPLTSRPAGRMPDLKLSALEAADIAHYLLGGRTAHNDEHFELDSAKVENGRALFNSLGCAQCHENEGAVRRSAARPLTTLSGDGLRGCLNDTTRVRYALTQGQRHSLHKAIAQIASESSIHTSPTPPAEVVERVMLRMNCYACHARHDTQHKQQGGVGDDRWRFFQSEGNVDFGDEGRIPPSLSGVGSKLTRPWLQRVLAGQGDVRPHMQTRMPIFGLSNVGHLPAALVASDHNELGDAAIADNGSAEAGRQLMDLGCIQCHSINGVALTGVVGVDLSDLEQRLRPAWFKNFLLNPGSVKPRTRMPTYFVDGKSVIQNILNGDPDDQIAAMWAYLKSTKERPLPHQLIHAQQQSFELIPTDEPILLRTFMRQAGTHAIAVGFREKVHFAFDARRVRLAVAWRGRFLDAHGTWFDRFAPPAQPLGNSRIMLPDGMPLATLDQPNSSWPESTQSHSSYRWQGFRLDENGIPTFLYRIGDIHVQERIEPSGDESLLRTLILHGAAPHLWFRATEQQTAQTGLQVRVKRPQIQAITVAGELRVPILFRNDKAAIEVEYRW